MRTGSNGDVTSGSFNEYQGLYGGGSHFLSSVSGNNVINGPFRFNGNATIGQYATISGPVEIGGSLTANSSVAINNTITAGGNITTSFGNNVGVVRTNGNYTQMSSFDVQTGNVFANGAVSLAGTVNGNVTYGTSYSTGPFGATNGAVINAASVATPTPFAIRTLPNAGVYAAGTTSVINNGPGGGDTHLSPGSYGALDVSGLRDLYLTAGDYTFSTFHFGGFTLHLEGVTAATPLRVFVTGDLTAGTLNDMTINGMANEVAAGNASLATLVSWETHGNVNLGNSGEWIGTIFAPQGSVTLGNFEELSGAVYASGPITTGSGATLNVVPEPTTFGTVTLLAALTRRRRN